MLLRNFLLFFSESNAAAEVAWAVEVAVRLMSSYDVVGEDVSAAFEVGDGAGYLEDAVTI